MARYRITLIALVIFSLALGSACLPTKPLTPILEPIESVTLGKQPAGGEPGWGAPIIPISIFIAGQDMMGMGITLKSDVQNEVILSSVRLVSKETGEASPLDLPGGWKLKPGKNSLGYWSIAKSPGEYEVRFYIDDTVIFAASLEILLFSEAEVSRLAREIHKTAWLSVASNAGTDEYYKYAIYASRILAVKHPDIYLQGDDIFVGAITTSPGFKKAFEIKDVHSEYIYTEEDELKGASFSFEIVEFSKYALISAKEIYPDSYPFLAFLDRRLAPISTTLKTFDHKITQLEKAEQLYFREKLAGCANLYLIYCDNENAYLYKDGLLLSMQDDTVENIVGNPVLIFNEKSVWYPLMDRDDTKSDEVLEQLVTTYSAAIDEPVVSEFEASMIDKLKKVTEIETTKQGLATLKIASTHLSGMARNLLIKHLKQQFPFIPSRTFNELANLISPVSAYLAAIEKHVGGEKGTKAVCDEYLRYASTPDQPYQAHGHAWFYWMSDGGLELSYRTHGGGCYVQANNIGAALWLAHIDHYRMAGFRFKKEGWGGHDFIYIPGQDLIVSNGKIEDLEDTVIDCADDKHREYPYKYLHHIEHRGKWVGIAGHYTGTLSPNEVLGILTYLRGIHGDDIQGSKITNNERIPIPFDELSENLKNAQKSWKPCELPSLTTLSILADFLGPDARELYNFEQIAVLLDTPDKVSAFMENNIKWDGRYDLETAGGNEYVPAWMVYERGIDDCDGHATIQAYFLKANGYDAFVIGIGIEGPEGHNVCIYSDNGLYWMLDNCGAKNGPFNSLDELGDSVISGASIIIFNPFDITSPTRNPFQLPHKVYRSSL